MSKDKQYESKCNKGLTDTQEVLYSKEFNRADKTDIPINKKTSEMKMDDCDSKS